MGVEGRASIRLLIATPLSVNPNIIVRAHSQSADLGFVLLREEVKCWLDHGIDAGLSRLCSSISLYAARESIYQLSLQIDLLADKVGVACRIRHVGLV